jgi:hemerythrin-like domain-containing protein
LRGDPGRYQLIVANAAKYRRSYPVHIEKEDQAFFLPIMTISVLLNTPC